MESLAFTIRKGYVWKGLRLTCYKDQAKTIPSNIAGVTASMKMRHKTKDVTYAFSLSVTSNVISVAKLDVAQTSALSSGEYQAELALTWPSGDKMGPYTNITFTVVGGIV